VLFWGIEFTFEMLTNVDFGIFAWPSKGLDDGAVFAGEGGSFIST
jgi:hypothetical protein